MLITFSRNENNGVCARQHRFDKSFKKKQREKGTRYTLLFAFFFYFPRYPVILASLLTDMLETYISNQRIMRKVGKRAIEATAIYPSTV